MLQCLPSGALVTAAPLSVCQSFSAFDSRTFYLQLHHTKMRCAAGIAVLCGWFAVKSCRWGGCVVVHSLQPLDACSGSSIRIHATRCQSRVFLTLHEDTCCKVQARNCHQALQVLLAEKYYSTPVLSHLSCRAPEGVSCVMRWMCEREIA